MVGVRGKTKLYTLLSREKYLIDMLFPQMMLGQVMSFAKFGVICQC